MADMWKAGDEVVTMMKDLIANHHPHLALVDDEIAVVFKEKGSSVGEVDIIGKTAKAAPLLGILTDTKWKFIITLAADAWAEMNVKQQQALLDHHLCGCRVDENEQTGAIKCYVAPADVSFYKGEIERHGMWRTSGAPPTPNLIEELFGDQTPVV
jgi:hypothetical protein